MNAEFNPGRFDEERFHAFMENYESNLIALIGTLNDAAVIGPPASDLLRAGITQAQFEELSSEGEVRSIYGLSPLQEGIYFHWLLNPDAITYVIQSAYKIRFAFDPALLEKAYCLLLQRHDVLRTSFHHQFGHGTIQAVRKNIVPKLSMIGEGQVMDGSLVDGFRNRDRMAGFDLEKASQMRLTVVRLEDHIHEFIWTYHHILMDGWRVQILINDFFRLYTSLSEQQPHGLPPSPPYRKYIEWLSGRLPGNDLRYWKGTLKGYRQPVSIPFKKYALASGESDPLGEESIDLTGQTLKQPARYFRRLQVTENSFLQAAWAFLLGRYNRSGDVFGSVVSGRPAEIEDIERMVGLFSNTVPMRITMDRGMTVTELVQRVQETSIAGIPHHYVKLADIRVDPEWKDDLFDHILICENFRREDGVMQIGGHDGGIPADVLYRDTMMAETNYDFLIHILPDEERIRISFNYKQRLFEPSDVSAMKDHFLRVILAFVDRCEDPLEHISLLSEKELSKLEEGSGVVRIMGLGVQWWTCSGSG